LVVAFTVYNYTVALQYDGSDNVIYQGWAIPGSSKSEAKWRIIRLTYSGSNVTDIQFADGSDSFNKIWDDRLNYTYA
jgi:hypothetical protein